MRRVLVLFLSFFCMMALCGCASIVNQGKETITISSTPSSANFQVIDAKGNPIYSGVTPQTIQLQRGSGPYEPSQYKVKFQKEGYQPQEYSITGTLGTGWYILGNLFSFGITGWFIVDPLTGAMWNLTPDRLSPELERVISGSSTV